MAAILSGFLAEAGRRRFVVGQHDCMLFVADWVRRCSGIDPAAKWRGVYHTEAEANILIEGAGGHAGLLDTALATAGWRRTHAIEAGDIILARIPGHPEPLAGIRHVGARTAFLTAHGILLWPVTTRAAWGPRRG